MKGTLRRSSSFMPGPKLFARWAARARASARATSLAAFAEATSTDCCILHRRRPSVARMVHQHNVCRWQAGIAGLQKGISMCGLTCLFLTSRTAACTL